MVNADNEAGITVSASSLITTEAGGTGTFTVRLNTAPIADVTIALASSDVTEATISPASLTFTAENWSAAQTVTVAGVDDAGMDGNVSNFITTQPATSSEPDYSGANPADVAVLNLDNDRASVVITPVSGSTVTEAGSSVEFSVVLNSEPTGDVVVSLASSDPSEGIVSPASRTFTPLDWATPQTFTLTEVDDATSDGEVNYFITATATSTDTNYSVLQPSVSASTADNEAAIALPSGVLVYGTELPGIGLDGQARWWMPTPLITPAAR